MVEDYKEYHGKDFSSKEGESERNTDVYRNILSCLKKLFLQQNKMMEMENDTSTLANMTRWIWKKLTKKRSFLGAYDDETKDNNKKRVREVLQVPNGAKIISIMVTVSELKYFYRHTDPLKEDEWVFLWNDQVARAQDMRPQDNNQKRVREDLQVPNGVKIISTVVTVSELKYFYRCTDPLEEDEWMFLWNDQVARAQDMRDGTFIYGKYFDFRDGDPKWENKSKSYNVISKSYLSYMDVYRFRKDVDVVVKVVEVDGKHRWSVTRFAEG